MPGLWDRLRSGKDRAAFEADKLRQIAGLQGQIRGLQKEVEQFFVTVGETTYRLYQQGRIPQPELQEVCRNMAALQAQIAQHERDVEELRQMEFEEEQFGHICPNGHGQLPPQTRFCTQCGGEAIDVPAPQSQNTAVCSQCGTAIPSDFRFCMHCGAPAPAASPASSSSPDRPAVHSDSPISTAVRAQMKECANCGAAVSVENEWCIYCGADLGSGAMTSALPAESRATTLLPETKEEQESADRRPKANNATRLLPEAEVDRQMGGGGQETAENATILLPETEADQQADSEKKKGVNATTLLPETEVAPQRTCQNCGAEMAAGDSWCMQCGSPQNEANAVELKETVLLPSLEDMPGQTEAASCPSCGADLNPGDFFCIHCGHAVGS